MTYACTLKEPQQWRAGWTGEGENRAALYFDCARCHVKEATIAGFLAGSASGTYESILVITSEGGNGHKEHRLALYCKDCWPLVLAEEKQG